MTEAQIETIAEVLGEKVGGVTYVHIHAPETLRKQVFRCEKCPDCKQKTWMICFFQEWYGWSSTCIKCGRKFEDGEWIALPFARGVRKANIADAKKRWKSLP